jgi:hypothetical protein
MVVITFACFIYPIYGLKLYPFWWCFFILRFEKQNVILEGLNHKSTGKEVFDKNLCQNIYT